LGAHGDPYPVSIGGGSFRIVGLPTSIDRNSTYFWVYATQDIRLGARLVALSLQNRLGPRSDFVVEQDRIMLEAIPLELGSGKSSCRSTSPSPPAAHAADGSNRLFEGRSGPKPPNRSGRATGMSLS